MGFFCLLLFGNLINIWSLDIYSTMDGPFGIKGMLEENNKINIFVVLSKKTSL